MSTLTWPGALKDRSWYDEDMRARNFTLVNFKDGLGCDDARITAHRDFWTELDAKARLVCHGVPGHLRSKRGQALLDHRAKLIGDFIKGRWDTKRVPENWYRARLQAYARYCTRRACNAPAPAEESLEEHKRRRLDPLMPPLGSPTAPPEHARRALSDCVISTKRIVPAAIDTFSDAQWTLVVQLIADAHVSDPARLIPPPLILPQHLDLQKYLRCVAASPSGRHAGDVIKWVSPFDRRWGEVRDQDAFVAAIAQLHFASADGTLPLFLGADEKVDDDAAVRKSPARAPELDIHDRLWPANRRTVPCDADADVDAASADESQPPLSPGHRRRARRAYRTSSPSNGDSASHVELSSDTPPGILSNVDLSGNGVNEPPPEEAEEGPEPSVNETEQQRLLHTRLAAATDAESTERVDWTRWVEFCNFVGHDTTHVAPADRVAIYGWAPDHLPHPHQLACACDALISFAARGGLVLADAAGAGKTLSALLVFVLLRQIAIMYDKVERAQAGNARTHLPADAAVDPSTQLVCPSRARGKGATSLFHLACPCVPGSFLRKHAIRPSPGAFVALAPRSAIPAWTAEWGASFASSSEARKLGLELVVAHDSASSAFAYDRLGHDSIDDIAPDVCTSIPPGPENDWAGTYRLRGRLENTRFMLVSPPASISAFCNAAFGVYARSKRQYTGLAISVVASDDAPADQSLSPSTRFLSGPLVAQSAPYLLPIMARMPSAGVLVAHVALMASMASLRGVDAERRGDSALVVRRTEDTDFFGAGIALYRWAAGGLDR